MRFYYDGLKSRSRGYLPHWEADRGIYFVPFRLADSLPLHVVERLRIHVELDQGRGKCVLRDPGAAQVVADALRFHDAARYELLAWCVMPNHVHVVGRAGELAAIVHSWKSYSINRINALLGRSGRVWAREYYDHLIRSERELVSTIAYVMNNPAKAELVDWRWVWSAG
jgi:REP element-mobilizing transposase RayT